MVSKSLLIVLIVLTGLIGCAKRAAVPKPRAYPKIEFPDRTSVALDHPDCPLTFHYPDYFGVEVKATFFDEKPIHPCWFDLYSKDFKARLHFSYHPIPSIQDLDQLVSDAFRIANKINQRSNYMDEYKVRNEAGTTGLILEFTGPAASPMHFYLTDSTDHFVKVSLYFDTRVNRDSLDPVIEFVQQDVAEIINSFKWQ